jgi:hypothetical protein
MDISVSSLQFKDPPVTRAELMRAQQMIAPVNFPNNHDKIELSEEAKVLAIKMASQAIKHESIQALKAKE